MSVLDSDFVDKANLQVENQRLREELQRTQEMIDWYDDMIFTKSRSMKMSEMYELIYGDTPLCDTCDGRTGFFLEIDRLYDAIHSNNWLLRILRWGHFYKRKSL